jgi:hypothetical protein
MFGKRWTRVWPTRQTAWFAVLVRQTHRQQPAFFGRARGTLAACRRTGTVKFSPDGLGIAFSLLGTRSIPFELGYGWIEAIPSLSTSNPDVSLGPEPTGIAETRSLHSDIFHAGRTRRKQRRAAGRTKCPLSRVAAFRELLELRRLALRYPHGAACHDQGWRISAAARNLAVAAMTIEHSKRRRQAFVADGATRAAAGEWNFHAARQSSASMPQ